MNISKPSDTTVLPEIRAKGESAYYLKASETERKRFEIQNKLLLRTTDNIRIHAPVELQDIGASVLESGTATGAWLLDLAKAVPTSTELIGIDIEPSLLPPPSGLPPNVAFHEQSILTLPSDWANKFSMVHQRLLFGSLRRDEWTIAIDNIYKSLKPGGWIQLFEFDEWVNAGPMLGSWSIFMEKSLNALFGEGIFPHGHILFKEVIEKAGFEDIRVRWFNVPVGEWAGLDGADMQKNVVYLIEAAKEAILKYEGFGVVSGGEEGYKKWSEAVEQEIREGATKASSRWVMILGKKPNTV